MKGNSYFLVAFSQGTKNNVNNAWQLRNWNSAAQEVLARKSKYSALIFSHDPLDIGQYLKR